MKYIYILVYGEGGYDAFDSHIVIAQNEEEARAFCPCADECEEHHHSGYNKNHNCIWQNPEKVSCEKIGVADDNQEKGVVLSSFNAG